MWWTPLDFSKLEAGTLQLSLAPVDLRRELDHVVRLLRPLAMERGLALSSEVDASVPVVELDSNRYRQVLVNLVGNAIKFTEEGSVALRVSARPRGDALELMTEVIDTGVGIPEGALVPRIGSSFRVSLAGSEQPRVVGEQGVEDVHSVGAEADLLPAAA